MAETDTLLYGRKTYEGMAAYWPTAPADDPFAVHLNNTPKYVAAGRCDGRLAELDPDRRRRPGRGRPAQGAAPAATSRVLGSAGLVQTLMAHDLVDEYSLTVFPIVLGSGKKLWRDAEQVRRLELVDSTPTTTGSPDPDLPAGLAAGERPCAGEFPPDAVRCSRT